MTASVQRSMGRGAAWMMLFKLAERCLGLMSTLVLVRVLAPQDFGVVAMAMSFIAVAELVAAFGFDLALIHKHDVDESHLNAAWTCNLMLGVTIMVVMLAAAQPIAHFYNRPDVFWVVCALAIGPAIGGAENIGIVAFRKDLDFKKEFRFLLTKKLLAVAITIPLALWLRSYWALVAGTLFSRAAGTTISYLIHPFRPRLSLRNMGELMVFSKWILVTNIVIVFKERTTDFVIGSSQGPRALGLFNVANEFANLPHTELAAPVNRALMPGFAKIRDDRAAVQETFISSIRLLAFIIVPAAAIIHAVSPFLVPVLFGAKWLDATPLMQVLSLAGGLIAMHSPMCSLLIAHGRPDRVAISHVFYVALLFTGLLVLLPMFGVIGAAFAVISAALLSTPMYLFQLRRHAGMRSRWVLRAVSRPLLAALPAVLLVRLLVPAAETATSFFGHLVLLAAASIVAGATYAGTVFLLWHAAGRPAGAERAVIDRIAGFLAARRSIAH